MLYIRVLGAAAGGGFPQWNSNSDACRRARSGDPAAKPATQASIALSADQNHWFLVNASPDLRQQIEATAPLQPREGRRSSPIAGIVLTNGDIDAILGLLHLREGTSFTLYAHPIVMKRLDENPIFEVLDRKIVPRRTLTPGVWQAMRFADGTESGIEVRPFAVPGKVPLYAEGRLEAAAIFEPLDHTLGLEIRAGKARLAYVANCAEISEQVAEALQDMPLVFMDGTLFSDDEMIRQGVGWKTGRRMGHVSINGENGSLERLDRLGIGRPIFIHINNTNPILLEDSPERRRVEEKGFEVAYDGMEISL